MVFARIRAMWQAVQQARREEAAVIARLKRATAETNAARDKMDEAAQLSRAALSHSLEGADKAIQDVVQKAALQRSLDIMEQGARIGEKLEEAARSAKPTDAYSRAVQAAEGSLASMGAATGTPDKAPSKAPNR